MYSYKKVKKAMSQGNTIHCASHSIARIETNQYSGHILMDKCQIKNTKVPLV